MKKLETLVQHNAKRKEPIHIRQRPLKNGNFSLFLDTWWNGEHSYEFLKLYLVCELTPMDKEQNQATWLLAETIKAKRIEELQKQANGFPSFKMDHSFIEYFQKHLDLNLYPFFSSCWRISL